jgi:DNA-binding SARP family transcriptional activator
MDASDASEPVSVCLLGGFRMSVDGRRIPADAWPSRRSAQLVQLLGLADRHRLARDQVIDTLWPRLDPQAGGANLRKAAHHARQAMGRADSVVLRDGHVWLFPSEAVATDVDRFLRGAESALGRGDPAGCVQAAAAYGGDLLPEARYEEWAQADRARLRARYLDLLRAGGQHERLAREEPTDEQAHRELMRAALDAGSRPAAIRWYGRLRTALERGLGVAPGPRTQALYEECVAGLGVSGPPLVGRQLELARAAAGVGVF